MKKLVKTIIVCLAIVGVLLIGLLGWAAYDLLKNPEPEIPAELWPTYTGQEVLETINAHRKKIGVQELQVDFPLCNNLVERWLEITKPDNGHQGWQEWLVANGLKKNGKIQGYGGIAELYTGGPTPQEALDNWLGSPGHKTILEDSRSKYVCVYTNQGRTVVEMATPLK